MLSGLPSASRAGSNSMVGTEASAAASIAGDRLHTTLSAHPTDVRDGPFLADLLPVNPLHCELRYGAGTGVLRGLINSARD
jgi:hypothetical protein